MVSKLSQKDEGHPGSAIRGYPHLAGARNNLQQAALSYEAHVELQSNNAPKNFEQTPTTSSHHPSSREAREVSAVLLI